MAPVGRNPSRKGVFAQGLLLLSHAVTVDGTGKYCKALPNMVTLGNVQTKHSPRNLVPLLQVPDQRPCYTARWLRRAVYERTIPFHKIGGRVFFDLDDLDAIAERGRHEPNPAA
jgi:hypothetical protein